MYPVAIALCKFGVDRLCQILFLSHGVRGRKWLMGDHSKDSDTSDDYWTRRYLEILKHFLSSVFSSFFVYLQCELSEGNYEQICFNPLETEIWRIYQAPWVSDLWNDFQILDRVILPNAFSSNAVHVIKEANAFYTAFLYQNASQVQLSNSSSPTKQPKLMHPRTCRRWLPRNTAVGVVLLLVVTVRIIAELIGNEFLTDYDYTYIVRDYLMHFLKCT